MRVVVAPDSFKGTIGAREAAEAIAEGWRAIRPHDELRVVPLADGGEGTIDAFATAVRSPTRFREHVTGPDGRPVSADWLLLDDGTAVLELAQSSGLPLMAELDPFGAHTAGLGQLAAAAIARGAQRLVIGLGGSASTDGGAGALVALGARLLDAKGRDLPLGGAALSRLHTVDASGLLPPPRDGVRLLCDVTAPLLGPDGAAHVFGPQKGADPEQIVVLESALARLAAVLGAAPEQPGMGAAGGTAYGLAALWGAELVPGARTIAELIGLPGALEGAELVVTGEGGFDRSSLRGKVVGSVIELAAAARVPVALVAGVLGEAPPASAVQAASLAELAGSATAAIEAPDRWLRVAGRLLAEQRGEERADPGRTHAHM